MDPTNDEVLFSSFDKFSSSCGWPSFYKPHNENSITYKKDYKHNMVRTEVRTSASDLHLGHVFKDLDSEAIKNGYLRFCINSAALKFVSSKQITSSKNQKWVNAWNNAYKEHFQQIGKLTLAGGCFWGVQHLLRNIFGVYKTVVGYANYVTNFPPSYKQVCQTNTGAVEAVQVIYNKKLLPTEKMLDIFFSHIDPTLLNKQGNDVGNQYRSGIYYENAKDLSELKNYFKVLENQYGPNKKIYTELLPLKNFALAEEEHQDYLIKNPNGYCHIKF